MTNIYKFRGKLPEGHRTVSGESWVYGDLVHIKGEPHIWEHGKFCLKVIPESVELYRVCEDSEEAVQLAPVVHGRWIKLPSMAQEYACSERGQSYVWQEVSEAHHRPNCGAKMDGSGEGG